MNQNRRPVTTRDNSLVMKIASWCAKNGLSPNFISLLSIVFSAISLLVFYLDSLLMYNHALLMIIAIVGIQGRLLMNLLDGMVAIEHNKKSVVGGLYNEVPDRISDSIIIFGAGLLTMDFPYGIYLSYLAIILSIFTAYIRTLGASLNTPHFFSGPMAKQHRMVIICLGCIVGIWYLPAFYYALIIMNMGLIITCVNRLLKIVKFLKNE